MVITLEIVTPDGTAFRRELGPAGGTIGRQKGCDVYLPDPDRQVSREHARISFRNGEFYVEDLSTGGLSINSLSNRIPQHQPHLLKSQDLLIIEPYKIRVVAVEGLSPIGDSLVPNSVDMGGPLPLDDLFPVSRPPSAATPREPTRGSVLSEHQPRPVVTPAGPPAAAVPSSP